MLPGKSTIDQLFNGTRVFVIPFYQRSYVWNKEHWERFLDDMIMVGHKKEDYFLGSIILKQELTNTSKRGDYKIVIDGQQRLTTIAIFLKVLYLKLDENAWFERKFILPDGNYAICHSHIDRRDFETIMKLEECKPLEGSSHIISAYNYFFENLDSSKLDMTRVLHNVQVIDIIIDGNDDEQQIFDTINSLGVDLTTAELLKNHLFDEKSFDEYEKLWKPAFEKDEDFISFWGKPLLKGRNKQINVEAFLNAFLQIKVHDPLLKVPAEEKLDYAKSGGLFTSYKKFISSYFNNKEIEFIKDLVAYAKIYYESFKPEIVEYSLTYKPSLDRINFLIFATDSTTMIPFIMYVIKNVKDDDEKNKIFEYLESYIVRRLICRKPTKSYSDLFSENLILAEIRSVGDLIEYINKKGETNNLAMPNNTELLRCFKELEYPNYRGLNILYLLESRLRNNSMLSTQLLKYSSYTLEHLMPQKWIPHWPLSGGFNADERTHVIKTLGNFTIITQPLNSTVSNDAWPIKVFGKNTKGGLKAYAKELLTLEGVLDLKIWDEKSIIARSIWLASKACNVWPSYIEGDKPIEEPIYDDEGEIIIDELTGEEKVISRDHTQYSLDGKEFMGKGRFVMYFIQKYIAKHSKMTFEELKEVFPDSLLDTGFKFIGLLCPVSAYNDWDNAYKQRRYHPDWLNSKLVSSDGIEFYVNTQWTLNSVQNIIQIAKNDHWDVMIKL